MLESISQGLAAFPGSDGTCMDQFGQGPSMLQVIQELRSLRSRVTKAWGEERRGFTAKDIDELVEFNETIDHLIANSVTAFSARKDRETHLIESMLKAFPDPAAIVDPGSRNMVIDAAIADMVNVPQRDADFKMPLELLGNADQAMCAARKHESRQIQLQRSLVQLWAQVYFSQLLQLQASLPISL